MSALIATAASASFLFLPAVPASPAMFLTGVYVKPVTAFETTVVATAALSSVRDNRQQLIEVFIGRVQLSYDRSNCKPHYVAGVLASAVFVAAAFASPLFLPVV